MVNIHDEIQRVINLLKDMDRTREQSLVITKLEEAQMWADKIGVNK